MEEGGDSGAGFRGKGRYGGVVKGVDRGGFILKMELGRW